MNKLIHQPMVRSSYKTDDVIFLLKDLSSLKLEDTTENRERQIQSGRHYSETLPIEYQPPKAYLDLFWQTLEQFKQKVALCIGVVAEQIFHDKGEKTVLVSLARAGTPIGILLKRYLMQRFNVELPHYSISIIRDRGIDENALHFILSAHPGYHLQFVDGWTGKGAISMELTKACRNFESKFGIKLDDTLAVIADPGCCTTLYGTREDFLIPSACLNSTVSGLVSRTVLNQYIGPKDFHGAKFYQEFIPMDVSNEYIDSIDCEFRKIEKQAADIAEKRRSKKVNAEFSGIKAIRRIQSEFQINNPHFIKPGVGETTRVLLRRVPWKILMRDPSSPYVKHVIMLAEEKGVEVVHYDQLNYLCCGLIKPVGVKN